MADAPKPPGRPMKYPYTYSAKIARFPYKFYFNNSWYFRYWCYSLVATFPLIVYLHKAVNSPANKRVWEEKRKHELEEARHHFENL